MVLLNTPRERKNTIISNNTGNSVWKLIAKKYTPHIVENQCGSSDINQSNPAKAMVKAKINNPGALNSLKFRIKPQLPVVSILVDQRCKKKPTAPQIAKYNTWRTIKNGSFRNGTLPSKIGSAKTSFSCVQWYSS